MAADLGKLAKKLNRELGVDVYQYDIDDYSFLFRPLKIGELELANKGSYKFFELEDLFVKAVTLYPEDFDIDDVPAGYITQYCQEILDVSGFDNVDVIVEMLERHRSLAENNFIFMMKSHIITAMPTYKEEDFDDLTMDQMIAKLVLAETILSIQTTMGTDYYSPDAFKIHISAPGEDGEEVVHAPQPQATPQPQPQQKGINPLDSPIVERKQGMSDEEYETMKRQVIQQIAARNAEAARFAQEPAPTDYSHLEKESLDSLKAMLGVTKENDPIAAKLAANRHKERNVARQLGLPYND